MNRAARRTRAINEAVLWTSHRQSDLQPYTTESKSVLSSMRIRNGVDQVGRAIPMMGEATPKLLNTDKTTEAMWRRIVWDLVVGDEEGEKV